MAIKLFSRSYYSGHSWLYLMILMIFWCNLLICLYVTGITCTADDVKQLAEEVRETIKNTIGIQNFVQVYSEIRKNLKAKRDKRKQEEKVMAVVNPMRNAKRKIRIAAKHRANKKRKIMTMKMGRWVHNKQRTM